MKEISLPIRVDAQGRIAFTSDPEESGESHLRSYLMTTPTERVMRPKFGTPIKNFLFNNLDGVESEILSTRVQAAVSNDVSDVVMQKLTTTEDTLDGTLFLNVRYALTAGVGQGATKVTKIGLGGSSS